VDQVQGAQTVRKPDEVVDPDNSATAQAEKSGPSAVELGTLSNFDSESQPASVSKIFKYSNTREMDPEYHGEELGIAPAWEPFDATVQYLNEAERQKYKVKVSNGLLTDANGIPLDSADTKNGKLMFVMDQNGSIYAGPQDLMEFHHSSFLSGDPVAAAGELEIAHGQVVRHSRNSGHYQPNKEHHEQFIAEMNERGIDLSNAYEDPVD
jgi:hypothetical protein